MGIAGERPRRLGRDCFELLVCAPVLAVFYPLGVLGHAGLWAIAAAATLAEIMAWEPVQRWLAGGDPTRRVWPRLGLHLATLGCFFYLLGWGPVTVIGLLAVPIVHTRISGARVWRPAAVLGVLCGISFQVAVGLGWIFSYLSPLQSQAVGTLGIAFLLICVRQLGMTVEHRERAEQTLRCSEERFRALVQDSSDVVGICDPDGRLRYVSPAVTAVTGTDPADLVGQDLLANVHPDDVGAARRLYGEVLAGSGEQRIELRMRYPDGTWHWLEMRMRNQLSHPVVRGLVVHATDVSERRAIQERLAWDANHDALTGLVNRAAFLRGLAAAGPRRRGTAVLFIDLDRFKEVNDTLGHAAGDAMLTATAAMLRRCVLGQALIGRLGGDEFGIVLSGISRPEGAVAVAHKLLGEMEQPVLVAGREVWVRASVGIALAGPDCADEDELLCRADVAMYVAKRRRVTGWQVYTDALRSNAGGEATRETDLRRALRCGELRLQYQPVVELDTGAMVGVEALVRWQHPVRGWLGPAEFIPLAEESGLICELGEWVLEHACRQMARWHSLGARALSLSVNLSPRQLEREGIVHTVLSTVERTGLPAGALILEITENAMVGDTAAIPRLRALNDCGIRLALDDFGAGYSSLRYLTRLPVQILKIDRMFVAELNGTTESSAVVEAVLRLAQILHLDTTAEGVETAAQARELTLLGCRTSQGYHFGRPMNPEAITTLLTPTLPTADQRSR